MTTAVHLGNNFDQINQGPRSSSGELQFLRYLLSGKVRELYNNIVTEGAFLQTEEAALPLTINRREFDNSYVCSPYSAYISYTREELKLLKKPTLARGLRFVIGACSHLLKIGKINKVVQVNNWLCSTNLYPKLSFAALAEGTRSILQKYPHYCVMFRSLNEETNGSLIRHLTSLGYELFPSRQIYVFATDQAEFSKKRMLQSDFSLLKKTEFSVVGHDDIQANEYARIAQLYRDLYIIKHSGLNPQITSDYIKLNHEHRLLEFKGLRDKDGMLQGVIGFYAKEGVLATHLIGYNTDLPQSAGVYRILTALLFQEAIQKKLILNFSSGAANFKRLRGGKAVTEYNAIYYSHLPLMQRAIWAGLRLVSQHIGLRVLKKFEL